MRYHDTLTANEQQIWNTESVFKPVSDWTEDDGQALFFRLDAGEPPQVTSPISSDWDPTYFTHFMALPKELVSINKYRETCIKSGIETEVEALLFDQPAHD